ncbi:MAG: hypothetical protein OER88_00905, partial [Planctomycetota bacterium]|nr:hypothetical protein [Planctomycetota bacterium]
SVAYVRSSVLLRWILVITVVDHVAAIAMVSFGLLHAKMAGYLALLSVLSWFFAVVLPMMNRTLRTHAGQDATGYWGELMEGFFRVVLAAQTGLYAAFLIQAALGPR